MSKSPTFYEMFDCCRGESWLRELLDDATVPQVVIDRARLHMDVTLACKRPAAPVSLSVIEGELAASYGLRSVSVRAQMPAPPPSTVERGEAKPAAGSGGEKTGGKVLMGRPIRGAALPMSQVSLDSGRVYVAGEVFGVEHRFLEKRRAWILNFSVSDYTNSLKVSAFFSDEQLKEGEALCAKIKNGMYLHIRGRVGYNRYDNDLLSLTPSDISVGQRPEREDSADTH